MTTSPHNYPSSRGLPYSGLPSSGAAGNTSKSGKKRSDDRAPFDEPHTCPEHPARGSPCTAKRKIRREDA
ncbi:hypothetical protein FIBSPDRAFT_863755, partial [Athelia psychrophila]